MKKNSGFTLVEILTVVAVIAILASIFLSFNISSSLKKARDSKRKQDLHKISKSLEDYYNDRLGYPPGDPENGIMIDAPWGGSFAPYIPLLPQDPLSPSRDYYYQTSAQGSFFIIYAKLENTGDPDIEKVGCSDGCGPDKVYNYYVASPNIIMIAGIPSTDITPAGGLPGATEPPGGGGTVIPPSPTPTDAGPSPTPLGGGGPLPTPTRPPGAECDHNTCCGNKWCGGGTNPPGIHCGYYRKCMYDPVGGWYCWWYPFGEPPDGYPDGCPAQ